MKNLVLRPRRRVRRSPTGVRLALGATLLRTGHVLAANVLPFAAFGLLVRTPLFLRAIGREIGWWGSEDDFLGYDLDVVGLLWVFLAGVLIQCFVIQGAEATLSRTRSKASAAFEGIRSAPSVIGVGVLVGALAFGAVFFARVLATIFVYLGGAFIVVAIGLVLLGGLLALMAAATFFVGAPAAVVEHLAPTEAMGRSAWITKGSRWGILLLVLPILSLRVGGWVLLAPWNYEVSSEWVPHEVVLGIKHLLGMGLLVLQAAVATVVYHDLRVAKEGATGKDVVDVFK